MTPQQIRIARELLELTQIEFANELNITARTVINIESLNSGYPCKQQTALAIECLLRRSGLWVQFESKE